MQPDVLLWLESIRQRIIELDEDVVAEGFENFSRSRPLQRSAERNIAAIGESMKKILRSEPQIMISEARRIVSTRNRLAHEYDDVSHDLLWLILERDIPALKKEVEELLRQHGE